MSEQIKKIKTAIKNIEDKNFSLLFFVYDTKGAPNGSLAYIYETAYQLAEEGYKVKMLYADKDFVGVESWLGDKYSSLPHELIDKDATITVSPSDFLFIPEIYSSVMSATKSLPCKRVVLIQNLSYLADTCPMGVSFEDLKIRDFITTSEGLKARIQRLFPVSKIDVVRHSIPSYFVQNNETKKLIINVVSHSQNDVNSIIKSFYWRFPQYKWVIFRPISNIERHEFADELSNSIATIWCDTNTDFGQVALECMAANSIVIGKIPSDEPDWLYRNGELVNNGIWFYNNFDAADIIASVVDSFLSNSIPQIVFDEMKNTVSNYTEEKQKDEIISVYSSIIENRKQELEKILTHYENKEKEEK